MLKKHGDWMDLGSSDKQKPVKEVTFEALARSEINPVGGWYGQKEVFDDDSECMFLL